MSGLTSRVAPYPAGRELMCAWSHSLLSRYLSSSQLSDIHLVVKSLSLAPFGITSGCAPFPTAKTGADVKIMENERLWRHKSDLHRPLVWILSAALPKILKTVKYRHTARCVFATNAERLMTPQFGTVFGNIVAVDTQSVAYAHFTHFERIKLFYSFHSAVSWSRLTLKQYDKHNHDQDMAKNENKNFTETLWVASYFSRIGSCHRNITWADSVSRKKVLRTPKN